MLKQRNCCSAGQSAVHVALLMLSEDYRKTLPAPSGYHTREQQLTGPGSETVL